LVFLIFGFADLTCVFLSLVAGYIITKLFFSKSTILDSFGQYPYKQLLSCRLGLGVMGLVLVLRPRRDNPDNAGSLYY
jgi:hypothetical protein